MQRELKGHNFSLGPKFVHNDLGKQKSMVGILSFSSIKP